MKIPFNSFSPSTHQRWDISPSIWTFGQPKPTSPIKPKWSDRLVEKLPKTIKVKRVLFSLIVMTSLNPVGMQAQAQEPATPPNVILIVTDDMGWGDVGYHNPEINTPTIDRLASEGLELDHFYTQPVCSPTRSSLMTGKSSVRLGITRPLSKNAREGLPLSEKILPQYFKDSGYQTSLVGKWHLGRFEAGYWPNNRGFDHFYGNLTGGVGHYDHIHGGALDWQRNGVSVREEGYSTHLLTDEAIEIIESQPASVPLFMVLSYAAPHQPNEAPADAIAEYQHLDDVNRQIHAAMITEVDRGIEKIYLALADSGMLENTIIWFMSDNGGLNADSVPEGVKAPVHFMTSVWGRPLPIEFLEFSRLQMEESAGNNEPFAGGKYSVYEGGVRVPAFIFAPSYLEQGKIDARITVNDVLPTLADAADLETVDPSGLDGKSQWDFLQGEAEAAESPFVVESLDGQGYFKEDWKLIVPTDGAPELYQIYEDPTELNNLASEYPEIVVELMAELNDFPRGEAVRDPLWKVALDPDSFGGTENRPPYAGVEGKISGPLHPSIYVIFALLFGFTTAFVLTLRWLFIKFKSLIRSSSG